MWFCTVHTHPFIHIIRQCPDISKTADIHLQLVQLMYSNTNVQYAISTRHSYADGVIIFITKLPYMNSYTFESRMVFSLVQHALLYVVKSMMTRIALTQWSYVSSYDTFKDCHVSNCVDVSKYSLCLTRILTLWKTIQTIRQIQLPALGVRRRSRALKI